MAKKFEPIGVAIEPRAAVGAAPRKVGDKVKVDGKPGTIKAVPVLAPEYLAKNQQYYSVEMDSDFEWDKDKKQFKSKSTGECRDHQVDTLGCVNEDRIS